LEDKTKELMSLVKDSLDQTAKASLDKVDSLKFALVESEDRLSSHVSLVTTHAIEQQIKSDVVPKLDAIERLLLANTSNSNNAATATARNVNSSNDSKKGSSRSGAASPKSDLSGASMEHMDRGENQSSNSQESAAATTAEFEESIDPLGNATAAELKVLEKLTTLESQIDVLCKVVIDGDFPQQDDAQMDPDTAARVEAMRNQLLSMPEPTQPPAFDKLDELIQIVNRSQETQDTAAATAIEFAIRQEQARKEEDEVWKASLKEMLASHQAGLDDLDAHLLALESGFKTMDTGFQDWTKTHRMSLNVYLSKLLQIKKSDSLS